MLMVHLVMMVSYQFSRWCWSPTLVLFVIRTLYTTLTSKTCSLQVNSSTCTSEGSLLEETMKNTTGENLQVNPMMIECFVFTNLQISQESIKHFVLHPSVCELNDPNFLYSQSQTLTSKWAPDKGFPLRWFTEIHPEVGTKSLDHHPTPSRLLETQSTINKRRS